MLWFISCAITHFLRVPVLSPKQAPCFAALPADTPILLCCFVSSTATNFFVYASAVTQANTMLCLLCSAVCCALLFGKSCSAMSTTSLHVATTTLLLIRDRGKDCHYAAFAILAFLKSMLALLC